MQFKTPTVRPRLETEPRAESVWLQRTTLTLLIYKLKFIRMPRWLYMSNYCTLLLASVKFFIVTTLINNWLWKGISREMFTVEPRYNEPLSMKSLIYILIKKTIFFALRNSKIFWKETRLCECPLVSPESAHYH